MSANKITRWFETLLITALFILASQLLDDPLSLNSNYPWIWFAPVLVALRYGLWTSQISILILLVMYLYKDPAPIFQSQLQLFILGGFLMTVTCALFHKSWSKKINDHSEIAHYLQTKIQSIANTYRLLSLAHKNLEQQYIKQPVTLRSSLNELREMLAKSTVNSQEMMFDRLINIVALHCSLEIAGIFAVKNNRIIPNAIVSIGHIKSPKPNDFLITTCIENSNMTFVNAKQALEGHASDYVLCAPIQNQNKQLQAILLVESIPFLSLNDENIGIIEVLIQYFSAGYLLPTATSLLKKYPDCPVDFANELARLMHLQQNTHVDSAIVRFCCLNSPHQEDYLSKLRQEKRGLDTAWETQQNAKKIRFVIMPLSGRSAVDSYEMRINDRLKQTFNTQLNHQTIQFKTAQLSAFNTPLSIIEDLLELT
jgi:hypothetical protein